MIISSDGFNAQNLKVSYSNQRLFEGYCTSKATHGADLGTWYFEIKVDEESKGNVRLGWCQILGDPQAPVGYDEYGYGLRDISGEIFHCSRPRNYASPFGQGTIIGCLIHLPPI